MSPPLPTITAPFRSVSFPLHHADSLPVMQHHRHASKRRSLSEGSKKKNRRGNKVVPLVHEPIDSPSNSVKAVATNASSSEPENRSRNRDYWNTRKWLVTGAMLEPVPQFYPLELNSTLNLDMSAEVISTRISVFMKRHSMACVFETARLEGTSPKLTKFAINLWKQQGRVLIEMQRLDGSCMEMLKIRNGLFHYLQTGQDCSLRRGPPAHCTVECIKRSVPTTTDSTNQAEQAAADALAISAALLASPCMDQNMLGMESLRVLSNPTICSRDCSKKLSRELVFGQGETHGLRNHLLRYFTNTLEPDYEESSMPYDGAEYEQGDHFGNMHHVALQVLVNALEVAVQEHQTTAIQHENLKSSHFVATLLDAFIYDLSVAKHRPQEAAMSARCLALIMDLMGEKTITSKWVDVLVPLVMEAHEYGKIHHLQLERWTHDLMEKLWHHDDSIGS